MYRPNGGIVSFWRTGCIFFINYNYFEIRLKCADLKRQRHNFYCEILYNYLLNNNLGVCIHCLSQNKYYTISNSKSIKILLDLNTYNILVLILFKIMSIKNTFWPWNKVNESIQSIFSLFIWVWTIFIILNFYTLFAQTHSQLLF